MAKQKETSKKKTTKKKINKKIKKVIKKKIIKKKRNVKSPATATKKAILLKELEKGLGIVSRACLAANIPRSNFYKWYQADANFKKKVDDIENIALDFVETQHYQLIAAGNPSSIIFHLKTKAKHRGYFEKMIVEHSGEINVSKLTDQELADIINDKYSEKK